MKVAISIPDALFKEAEAAAKALGISRSKLIQTALEAFLQRRREEKVTAALNRSYARHPPEVDPFLQRLVLEGMKRTEWKE
jgi:metal-responsive CopG/Arc/MetJ family transcriptional regulator